MPSNCPLCLHPVASAAEIWEFSDGECYRHCPNCDLIFAVESDRPAPADERARYLEHNNSEEDAGYTDYLRGFAEEALTPYLPPPGKVLDFGSGPEPVFVAVLGALGFSVNHYDPHFAPGEEWQNGSYDGVTMVEVAEHLFHPRREFMRLHGILKPGGILAVRTLLHWSDRSRFDTWWYRKDITHVSFYSDKTFRFLADELGFELVDILKGRSIVLRKR